MPDAPRTHRFISTDGLEILVGRAAADNDALTFEVAAQDDFWLHVATTSGSHVVIVNPDRLERPPRKTLREAAALAVHHSKNRGGGKVAVHWTKRKHVRKRHGAPAGEVVLSKYEVIQVSEKERPPDPSTQP